MLLWLSLIEMVDRRVMDVPVALDECVVGGVC